MIGINDIALKAKAASRELANMSAEDKKSMLYAMADSLRDNVDYILFENNKDINKAKSAGTPEALIDRLMLNKDRIEAMAQGLTDIADLDDPIGEVMDVFDRPNGLKVEKVRVPFGVVGIIYESRPNVTADAIAICIKTSNAVILKGGKEAINSNIAIANVIINGGMNYKMPPNSIVMLEDTSRESASEMMNARGYIDLLIPRGGAGLISSVVENAKVPVIQTGVGNCHLFIDETADRDMALNILINAKTSRPGVCNAIETLLVHRNIAADFLPVAIGKLKEFGVKIVGCDRCQLYGVEPATDEDFYKEFLDLKIAIKVVDDVDAAIEHINKYGTMHSESIITQNEDNAKKFMNNVDSSCVYVNASTRFTDGFEFGFGAEIGISTQKLHARGPMGLKELTSYKYIINGNGQIR